MAIPGMSPVVQADELKKIRPLGTPPTTESSAADTAAPSPRVESAGGRPTPAPLPPLGGPGAGAGTGPAPLGRPAVASGAPTAQSPPALGGGATGSGGVSTTTPPVPPQPIQITPIPIGPPATGGGGSTTVTSPPGSATTGTNPMQQGAWNYAQQYANSLMGGTNEMITRELQRARDEISVGMKSEGEAAMGRGATPHLFRERAQAAGARNLGDLQGRLADVALGRAEGAGRLLGDISGASAAEQRMMHLGTLSSELERQRLALQQNELQARLNEAPYNRLMEMMNLISRTAPTYASLTELGPGGSGYFGGGGGAGSGGFGPSRPNRNLPREGQRPSGGFG